MLELVVLLGFVVLVLILVCAHVLLQPFGDDQCIEELPEDTNK